MWNKSIKMDAPSSHSYRRLGELLVEYGFATNDQIDLAIEKQRSIKRPLGEVLLEQGVVTEAQLLSVVAEQHDVEYWDLAVDPPTEDALRLLNAELAFELMAIPVAAHGHEVVVAMRNPRDVNTLDALRMATRRPIRPMLASVAQINAALKDHYGIDPEATDESVDEFVTQALDEYSARFASAEARLQEMSEDELKPVAAMVNQIIGDGVKMRASDIHLEPRVNGYEIRYCIDGRLVKIRQIPIALIPMIAARIRIMAELDVTDHRIPQDGRIQVQTTKRPVDLRVSVLPNLYGPRIVLRILDRSAVLKKMEDLGFSAENHGLFQDLIEKPYGIILVTGPTGSGKTTTLYAALNALKSDETNIMTCEDPIEYELDGINQSQINEKIGLTFAQQLRSVLRQDPDIVLVGEIRDAETAETAVRASLTGHLVLSTLYSNDAPSAVARLLDMGIDPFLLSTSLIGIVAQRLVRVLCPHCKEEAMPNEKERALFRTLDLKASAPIFHAKGCPKCSNLGYRGRTAIHEVLVVTEEVSKLIASGGSLKEIRQAAMANNFRPMQLDAIDRVFAGQTTLDEAKRLIFYNTFSKAA